MKTLKSTITFTFLFFAQTLFSQTYKAGDKVQIKWENNWYSGKIEEIKNDKYLISYDGFDTSWNEIVGEERLKLADVEKSIIKETTKLSILQETGKITDTRDGKVYKTIVIGTQTWMAQNLDVSTFRNGDTIPYVENWSEWKKLKTSAWCYYENKSSNGPIFGKLYNWYAINDSRGLAPEGWHIPTDSEWTELSNFLGGEKIAGDKIKSTSGWAFAGNGSNTCGFTGLPSGGRTYEGDWSDPQYYGIWWSSTIDSGTGNPWMRELSFSEGKFYKASNDERCGKSVRCIKD
jgi:uncharacterized protein (TIGR02145 family)